MTLDLEKIDLGSFGVNRDDQKQNRLGANLSEAFKVNPDRHARTLKLSKDSGVPDFAVASDPDEVEHKLKLDQIDLEALTNNAPRTADFIGRDFNTAVIAQEDITDGVLESIEGALTSVADVGRAVPAGFLGGFGSAFTGSGRILEVGARSTARGLDAILPESFDRFLYDQDDTPEALKIAQSITPQAFLTLGGEGLSDIAADIGVPEERQNTATDIAGAVGQIGQQIATYFINPAAAVTAMFAQGVDQQGSRQEASGTEGESLQSDIALLTGGAITAGSEKLGLDAILNRIPPKIKNDILRQVTDVAAAGGIEALQEVVENVAHGVLELYTTNPDAEIFEGLEREAIAAGGAGAIVRGIINAITPGRVRSLQDAETYNQSISEIEQGRIDALSESAEKSKLKERDVETFKQFVREADGDNNTHVFIDSAQTALYLQSKTRDEIESDPALKTLDNALRESRATGADIAVAVEDFTGDLTGTEHFAELRDHMTLNENSVSPFRQEQHQRETQSYVRALLDEANENVSEYVEAQEIYTSIRDQLVDTGAVSAQNASVMAQVVPAWATAQARRSGRTVAQVYADAGLIVQGPQTGELERLENESVFNQVDIETEAFRSWSNNGEVIESDFINDHVFGANTSTVMKVFHGTTREFSVFDALRGNLEGQFGAVNYFTSSEQDAVDNYGGEGPDLTNRITQRSEQLEFEVQEVVDDVGLEAAIERFVPDTIEPVEDAAGIAQIMARKELHGGQDRVMELFVKVDNPFVIGENAEWIEFVDNDEIQSLTIDRVAEANDITIEEVNENIDEYEDQIDEARWEIESEQGHPLVEAIQLVASRYNVDASSIAAEIYDLGSEATPEQIEQLIRGNEEISYAEDPETGALVNSQLITEVIQEMGFDSIILRNAEERFSNMNMSPGTTHVHIFDSNKTNIKSATENVGTFDPREPNIFRQQATSSSEPRGYYDPANSVIRLTEAADLSTFLHEFAHFMYEMEVTADTEVLRSINGWYKRNADDVAKEAAGYLNDVDSEKQDGVESTPGEITGDEVVAYLDDNTTGDNSKDAAIRRAVHEQFARGFETYLMEGKAPSIELRNAFRTFARWLAQIYQNMRGQLNVNLDDQMRQVFDRLLATEEQIAAAEARARVEPLFTDATMAGMSEDEFAEYKKRQSKVKDVQSETLRDKLIAQLTRKTKDWWKEEKQDLVVEEIDKLRSERVYTAAARLKDGDIKLDHATVKEMTGEERTDKLGRKSTRVPEELRGMTAKGQAGVHPDEAAAFFGYESGDQMLNDLMTAPKIQDVAESNAEQRMIERHGDIFTDGTIEQLADEAIQSEERGRLLLSELKALTRGTSQRTLERQAIKAIAKERIGQLSFREIHPGKYRKAEIRAAQESARMLAEGNREGAAQAKQRQVVNYYMGLEATEAKNSITGIVDRMARYNKKKVREEIQKAEGGYWDQIVKILERFEFRKSASLKQVDQVNQSINTWVKERMDTDGDALVLHNAVLNESFVTHWKNVAYSDMQGISDSVKNIEHVARYANKLTRMGEEIEFNKLVDRWTTSIDEKVETRFESKRTDVVEGRNWGRQLMSQMSKIPWMASWLDGSERAGISHQVMVQPFTDAYATELELWKQSAAPVMEAIEGRSKEDRKRHSRKIFIPEINDHLYGNQILAVALNTGNESNLRKLLLGEGWANPDNDAEINFGNPKLQAVLKHMTASDWQMVQLIWNQMETLYPKLAEVHRRTTGLTPPKVESTPVETPFGTFKGGYYPVKYDPNRSLRAAENEDRLNAETESMFSNNASIQASVNAGATNERTGFYDAIRLSLDVVPAHFQETIHYITHHDPVREVNRLLRNPKVAKTIKEKLGPEEYAQLRPWLNDIAKDGRETPSKMFWDNILQRLRFGVTLGAMGFKASTGIIQVSGLSNTMAEVGMAETLKGVRTVLGDTTKMREAWDFAKSNSKVMAHRTKTMDREIKNAMARLEGKRGILAAAQEASMKHIALIQTYMVDLPSWHAAYSKGIKEWGDEQRAFQYADFVVEQVQGSGATKDLARIMRNQAETGRMFTMFMTFFSSLWNMERDLVKGAKSGTYSTTTVAAKMMFLFTVPVLFEMLLRGEFSSDDDDDEVMLQKVLTNAALYPIQSVPFIRDIANASTGEFGYNISPMQQVLEQGIRTIPEVVERGFTDEEITKGQIKGATKFIGAATGVPGTGQAWATGEHLYEVLTEGEDLTLREFLFGPER